MVGSTVLMITYYQLIVILMAEDREGDGAGSRLPCVLEVEHVPQPEAPV